MKRTLQLVFGILVLTISSGAANSRSQNTLPTSTVLHLPAPVPVERDGKWGYADGQGKVIIAPQFNKARKFSDGLAAVQFDIERSTVTSASQNKWGFIDEIGKVVIGPAFEAVGDFSEGLAPVSPTIPSTGENTWGFIDRHGKIVIKPQFSAANSFSEGLALVSSGGVHLTDPVVPAFVKMGYIDKTGQWIIASRLAYFFYDNFSEGVVPFRKNLGKWGYMDTKGNVVIRPRFAWAGNFSGGLAPVLLSGNCVHIDKAGRVVGSPAPEPSTQTKTSPAQNHHGTYSYQPSTPPCS